MEVSITVVPMQTERQVPVERNMYVEALALLMALGSAVFRVTFTGTGCFFREKKVLPSV